MFSNEYGDWLTDQWWFWVLIAFGSFVAGVLGCLLITWRTHRRRRQRLRREFEVVAQEALRQVNAFSNAAGGARD